MLHRELEPTGAGIPLDVQLRILNAETKLGEKGVECADRLLVSVSATTRWQQQAGKQEGGKEGRGGGGGFMCHNMAWASREVQGGVRGGGVMCHNLVAWTSREVQEG